MVLVYADLELINRDFLAEARNKRNREQEIRRILVKMVMHTGSQILATNERIQEQIGFLVVEKRKS